MEELVKFIAQKLVDNPDAVTTTVSETDDETVITLSVAPEDMGKVIGKQGRIAKSIRTVVRSASAKLDKKYTVDIS